MQNLCYFISDVNKSSNIEWMIKYIDRKKFNLFCIILSNSETELELFLKANNITFLRLNTGKSNVFKNILTSRSFLKKHKISVIHCHLFEACIVGMLSGYFVSSVKKRIHTRHNSTIHHDYFPHAVKYDKLINYLSTHIISISDIVTTVLVDLENVPASKITKIYHGFDFKDLEYLANQNRDNVQKKYSLDPEKEFYIGSISRFVEYKGVNYTVSAFEKILKKIPNAKLILANASGTFADKIIEQLKSIPKDRYIIIPFEPNIYSLIKFFKIFIHVPISKNSEAFGQVYIESMFLGVPGIFTNSGIGDEIITNEVNAVMVDYANADEIAKTIIRLHDDKALYEKISSNSKITTSQNFDILQMINKLENMYAA